MPEAASMPDASDRAAIAELLARAAYALDEREDAMLSACFSEDACFSLRIAGGELVGPFEGREAIMGLMRGAWESQTDKRRHVVSNVFYAEGGEPAQRAGAVVVRSYLTLLATENGESHLLSAGVYRDEVLAGADGWQLVRRHLDLDKAY